MEGMTYEQLGFDTNRKKAMLKRLQDAAKPLGLKFSGKRTFVPNTVMSHLLTEYTEEHGGIVKQNYVVERLLKAFFGDAAASLDKEFLLKVASEVGLDMQDVTNYITSPENEQNLRKKSKSRSEQGLCGVPFFIMNGRPTFSGAQESSVFKSTILKRAMKE